MGPGTWVLHVLVPTHVLTVAWAPGSGRQGLGLELGGVGRVLHPGWNWAPVLCVGLDLQFRLETKGSTLQHEQRRLWDCRGKTGRDWFVVGLTCPVSSSSVCGGWGSWWPWLPHEGTAVEWSDGAGPRAFLVASVLALLVNC